jgi:hypothetical protein
MQYVRAARQTKHRFDSQLFELEVLIDMYISPPMPVPTSSCGASRVVFVIDGQFGSTLLWLRQKQQPNQVTRVLGQLFVFWALLSNV